MTFFPLRKSLGTINQEAFVKKRKCKNKDCRCYFVVSPQHPDQEYCSRKECQSVRKRIWERKKLAQDETYRQNKADSQKRWTSNNPWYWKKYRQNHPDYTRRNREQQKKRDQRKRDLNAKTSVLTNLAKTDVSNNENDIISGIYTLVPTL